MNYFRRTLPSLDPLVFFEAAARLKSYSRAARELNVSQVAVSKRIKGLEAEVGKPLFQRLGRSVALTAEGHAFAERVRSGLGFLEEAVMAARTPAPRQRQVVQVAANENINFFWLAPRVRSFQMAGNDAVVSVVTANNVNDVVRDDTDLAIFYGKAPPEGWMSHALFGEIIAPVASPKFRAKLERGTAASITLLDYRKEAPEWVNWDSAAVSELHGRFPNAIRRHCSSYIQSISLAIEGRGIALGVLPMLHREVEERKPVPLIPSPIDTGHQYFLATPKDRPRALATQELLEFLNTP